MKIITSIKEMQQAVKEGRKAGETVGFVPTMGYLHEGHLTLLEKARSENSLVVMSIFVNPLQFGPGEDFEAYPRDIARDEALAEENGADYLFYPSVEEMYPGTRSVTVQVLERTDVLCGRSRPGHFDGVATVLTKLFNIVSPDRAYFGMKDAQQVAVVHGLVADFNFPLTIVPVETVRESDGLAKSSRNVYLTETERAQAPVLYKSLSMAQQAVQNGERNSHKLKTLIEQYISSHTDGIMDYVEIYSYPELKMMEELSGKIIIALAVKFTKARLIDNITFEV